MKAFQDFNNEQVKRLPEHLRKYIVDQEYEHYTPVDHALWRYVMRQNYSFLKDAAYYPYIPGLKKAGLTIEKIPSLQEINDALAKIGWGAVTVDGFIPPAAFMEYQAWRVLVVAADIRTLDHIEYTPAPDIIHESAGHAPIISDVHYNGFLSHLGAVGAKAMFSKQDHELYEAIRALSILKETHGVDPVKVKAAEELLFHCQQNMGEPSEMALLSRLQWWTVEYGLIGSLENPKIYGAGLLSSIGESSSCMRAEVKKIPYTIDAVNYAYDITKPQPQLFVTPTFENLLDVLHQFESGMAMSVGGTSGLKKAIASEQICTVVLDNQLQISGLFKSFIEDEEFGVCWVTSSGSSALCRNDKALNDFGTDQFPNGCNILIGKIKGTRAGMSLLTSSALSDLGIVTGAPCSFVLSNGISVVGYLDRLILNEQMLEQMHFSEVEIKHPNGTILYSREFGNLKLLIGTSIPSVFSGAADKMLFDDGLHLSGKKTDRAVYTAQDLQYHNLFAQIRAIREGKESIDKLIAIWKELKMNFSEDWLGAMEVAEMTATDETLVDLYNEVRSYLEKRAKTSQEHKKLINDGLSIIDRKMIFI
ncbi:MAG: aromatic amino acid hydroxylase [Chitinophagaceae bacterium]